MIKKRMLGMLFAVLFAGTAFSLQGNTAEAGNTEMVTEMTPEEEIDLLLEADNNLAEGIQDDKYGKIKWVIDENGHLMVVGEGDVPNTFGYRLYPWSLYTHAVVSAEIHLTGTTDATEMFSGMWSLKSIDLSGFDTSKVTSMRCMFDSCNLEEIVFGDFDTGNVTDMTAMFRYCDELTALDLSHFKTEQVTDLQEMFKGCTNLKSLNLDGFDTQKVSSMREMFYLCEKLEALDLKDFKTGQVTDMEGMFQECRNLRILDISNFDTKNVTTMKNMFNLCNSLEQLDLQNFNTRNVETMENMFCSCSSLTKLDVSSFDTRNVTNMQLMFDECEQVEELNLQGFYTGNVTTFWCMFRNCKSLTSLDLFKFDSQNCSNMSGMFEGCEKLEHLDLSHFNSSYILEIDGMFHGCKGLKTLKLGKLNTAYVREFDKVFKDCASLTELDVSMFDTANAWEMNSMFEGCESLETLDVSNLRMDVVDNAESMFKNCKSLKTLDLSQCKPRTMKTTANMFRGCSQLEELNINNFDFRVNKDFSYMFAGCENLKELDFSSFRSNKYQPYTVENMTAMFQDCKSLKTIDLSGVVTPYLEYMGSMFSGCSSLEKVLVWKFDVPEADYTPYVEDMQEMFKNCTSLKELDLSPWIITASCDTTDFFDGCAQLESILVPVECWGDVKLPKPVETDLWYCQDGTMIDEIPLVYGHTVEVAKNRIPGYPPVNVVFMDVPKGTWYLEYVQYVFDKGLMRGDGSYTYFHPEENITKAQVAQVLYNMDGSPLVFDDSACRMLQDVYSGEWYEDAVCWAYSNGIITGDLNTRKFYPNSKVTREQLALMFCRYGEYKGLDVTQMADISDLLHWENVSNWAEPAVKWAVQNRLISGMDIYENGKVVARDLAPQGNATRAQVAAIMMRFLEETDNENENIF